MIILQKTFFKLSLIADLQEPFNLGVQFFNDILWHLVQIFMFEALYLHVNLWGEWGVAEMRVFLGILFLVDALQMLLFAHNFDVFPEKAVRRDLDLHLLRPVSSLQLMTSQRSQCSFILNALCALVWTLWSLSLLPGGFCWTRALLILVVVPAALAIFYATRTIFCTVSLLVAKAEYFHELYFAFSKLGRRPDWLYGPLIRFLILVVIPIGMIASVPTRALIDPLGSLALPILLLTAIVSLFVTNRFWHWSVKRYTSL